MPGLECVQGHGRLSRQVAAGQIFGAGWGMARFGGRLGHGGLSAHVGAWQVVDACWGMAWRVVGALHVNRAG
eukprot:365766-Chlamydomonas_euryale.AAC.4